MYVCLHMTTVTSISVLPLFLSGVPMAFSKTVTARVYNMEPYQGELDLEADGWEIDPALSLHEAAHLLNARSDFQSGYCSCKSGCSTKRCVCKQKGGISSAKCHGERSVVTSLRHLKQSKSRSRHRRSNAQMVSGFLIYTSTCRTGSHLSWLTDKHMWASQNLLKKQFSHVDGLQPTVLTQND